MHELFVYSLSVFMGFFAVMNPIANTPIFIGLVEGKDKATKARVAKVSTVTAFLIVASFVLLGRYIFEIFGLTIPAFKLTGGILIFFVGFEMLMSSKSKVQDNHTEEKSKELAISPLGIPILAGPGTIVTAMNNVTDADFIKTSMVIIIFAFLTLLTYVAFRLSDSIMTKVGPNLILVIGKIMGLILAIIGMDMITTGIKLSFNL